MSISCKCGNINETRYDNLEKLLKQIISKEKIGGDQSQDEQNPLLDRDLQPEQLCSS